VISTLAGLFLRWWLIRVLLLLAENVEDLVYSVWLLSRVRVALIGSRILFPQQVPQNATASKDRRITSYERQDDKVRVYGDTAVMTYRYHCSMRCG